MDYVERQEATGLKVGDLVEIYSKPTPGELEDWGNVWSRDMDKFLVENTKGKIQRMCANGIDISGCGYRWPYQSLRLAPKVITLNFSEFKWIARDHSGEIYLYNQEPIIDNNNWDGGGGYICLVEVYNIPDLGKDWKDSLHKIPPDGTLTHVPRTHTLTIDGKDITISKESFNNLKEQLTCT